jgi:uncharacterized protein YegJ (DUF2314 family)
VLVTRLRQAFGLVAMVAGTRLLITGVLQQWLHPSKPLRVGSLIIGLVLGPMLIRFGWRWLSNLIALDVLSVEPDDPEIAAASRRARATLSTFWDYLGQNRYECFVKFPMKTTSSEAEHIWAVVHSRTNGSVVVSLANNPIDRPKDASDRRVVSVNDIEDWHVVVSDAESRGGFSITALERIAKSRGHRLSRADQKRLRAFVDREPA